MKADLQLAWRVVRVHVGPTHDVVIAGPVGAWANETAVGRAFSCAVSRRGRILAVGDSEVVDVLERVSPALPLPAQRAVETARAEIEQEELYTARYWISVAVAEAERTELGR